MSTDTEPIPAAAVRRLERWGVPFHYVVPVAVAVVGWLLLAAGGAMAFVGGWWLVVALPIAIGSLLRDPRLAAGPLAVWIVWLVIAAIAGDGAGVAHTPFGLAIALGVVGGAATRVAQFAIFPATTRAAWVPAVHRPTAPGGEPGVGASAALPDGEPTLPDLDMSEMTVTFDAIEPIGTAEHEQLRDAVATTSGEIDLLAAVAKVEAAAKGSAEADADAAPEPEPEPAVAEPAVAEPAVVEGPEPAAEPAPKVVHVELPLDVDPAPLDEGGHVTEFRAITEADVLAADPGADQPGSDVP